MSTWKLNSVGAKYNTEKNCVESEVKFDLWKKSELKVLHKSGTNDVAFKFKMNSPIEIEVEHDVRPKNTTMAADVELFKDRVDLKVKQSIPGNKPTATAKTDLKANLKSKKSKSKQPMSKTALNLSCRLFGVLMVVDLSYNSEGLTTDSIRVSIL